MTMAELISRPTDEQLRRFRALSVVERYSWLTSMLRTTYALATDATRTRWRETKQAIGTDFVANVAVLVRALDSADFESAEAALDAAATYEKDGATIVGAPAIAASYRASHERATATLARIVYRSRLEPIAPGKVRVCFEDRIEVGGRSTS